MLLQVERGRRGGDPVAALFELGREDAQLARPDVELPFALPQTFGVDSCTLDLRLAIPQLLLQQRDPLLALEQLLLGLLDHLALRVEVGPDLLEATCPRLDLGGAARHRLAEQALAVGETPPGLLELVPLVGHYANHAVRIRPQGSASQNVFFHVGGLVVPLVLALAAVSPAQAPNPGCGGGKLVLSVSYHVANDVDTGVQGNNWAFDTYDRSVRVWRKGR